MGPAKIEKRSTRGGNPVIQQQISTMFGEKVKKPRMYMGSAAPTKPVGKQDTPSVAGKVDNGKLTSPTSQVASRKRRWRLSELLKKEREKRTNISQASPSFVFEAPHMDSRRPDNVSGDGKRASMPVGSVEPPRKKTKLSPTSIKYNTGSRVSPSSTVHHPGGDALVHDRSLLPKSHLLLLDVLQGLESAITLLRTRQTRTTISAVREIVSRSTRRTFTLRILSQLAHIVPEAVTVLPGINRDPRLKRSSDNLIVRLDDCSAKPEESSNGNVSSVLGGSGARIRRSLLHKRLLSHVREHHVRFLQEKKVTRYSGNIWHPEFDPDAYVPDLPAPPLYPIRLEAAKPTAFDKKIDDRIDHGKAAGKKAQDNSQCSDESAQNVKEDSSDLGIPSTLLERVRARELERSRKAAVAEVKQATNQSLLTKLPCTMDTVLSVLRGERRSAIGWLQLLSKLEKQHPKKWERSDLESQLTAITDLATGWCKKVELKSSRGGYAFRIISPGQFVAARKAVCAVKCYPVKKD